MRLLSRSLVLIGLLASALIATSAPAQASNDYSRLVGWCVEYGVYWNGYSGPHIRTGYACYNR